MEHLYPGKDFGGHGRRLAMKGMANDWKDRLVLTPLKIVHEDSCGGKPQCRSCEPRRSWDAGNVIWRVSSMKVLLSR